VSPRLAAQWIASQLLPLLKEHNEILEDSVIVPERLANLLLMLEREEINANTARDVLKALYESSASPGQIVAKLGCRQVSEAAELEVIVDRVLEENPSAVDNFLKGASKAMGFLMGKAMQATGGKANTRLLKEIMTRKLQ